MNKTDIFFETLAGVKERSSGQFIAKCAWHDDNHNSFSFNDEGLWKCFAGCGSGNAYQFAERMGKDPKPFIDNNVIKPKNGQISPKKDIEKLDEENLKKAKENHNYLIKHPDLIKSMGWTNEAVKRTFSGYDEKEGRYTFLHFSGGFPVNIKWHKGKDGESPYSIKGRGQCRLFPQQTFENYDLNTPLVWVEGEKDVLLLISKGFQAITTTTGAGSIPKDLTKISRFKKQYILYDNDQAGIDGSLDLAQAVFDNSASEIKIVEWGDEYPNKFDVSDFLQSGKNEIDLQAVLDNGYIYKGDVPEERDFPEIEIKLDKEKLTPVLIEFLEFAAGTTDAPDEFLISSFLTFWAGVVANKLKAPFGLRSNVWVVLFAQSSMIRKSTALRIAGQSFQSIQKKFDEGLKEEWAKFESDLLRWEDLSRTERADTLKPETPQAVNIILPSDFSDAGFYVLMKNNPASGVIVTGEFADFHYKLKRDITGQADAFLSAYDNDRMVRQTVARGTEVIEEPSFSILGATTTGNFLKVFSATETENGFIQRIMPVVILKPTKKRKLFLKRTEMSLEFSDEIEKVIINWFRAGEIDVELNEEFENRFCEWEVEFRNKAIQLYSEKINEHLERMIPACLKVAMLCESLRNTQPPEKLTLKISSLECAIMIVENLFLPSMAHLLENEIIFEKNHATEKKIEKILKSHKGRINRTELMRESRLSKRRLDETIENMKERGLIKETILFKERMQGGGSNQKLYSWIDS